MTSSPDEIRNRLSQEKGTIDWPFLQVHARAENLIIVGTGLNLLDVAVAIATDDAAQIHTLLSDGNIHKPSPSEQSALQNTQGAYFEFVIVAPFVVAQQIQLNGLE